MSVAEVNEILSILDARAGRVDRQEELSRVYDKEGLFIYKLLDRQIFRPMGVKKCVKILGQGGFGRAYLVEDSRGKRAVLKTTTIINTSEYFNEYISTQKTLEERLGKACERHGVICYYKSDGIFIDNSAINKRDLIIGYSIMNAIDGVELSKVKLRDVYHFFDLLKQYIDAVAYLHRKGIIHYDLKPANVMVSNRNKLFIIDLDTCKIIDGDTQLVDTPSVATRGYMASLPVAFRRRGVNQIPAGVAKYMDYYAVGQSFWFKMQGRDDRFQLQFKMGQQVVEVDSQEQRVAEAIRELFKGMRRSNYQITIEAIKNAMKNPIQFVNKARGQRVEAVKREMMKTVKYD